MRVVFNISPSVCEIRVDRLHAQGPGRIVDLIRRVDKFTTREADFIMSRVSLAVRRRLEISWKPWQWTWATRPNSRGIRGEVVVFRVLRGILAWIGTHIGGFVHVDPEAVDVDAGRCVEDAVEFAVPVVLDVRMEPVWECSDSRPYSACMSVSI